MRSLFDVWDEGKEKAQRLEETPTFNSGHKAKGPKALLEQAEKQQEVHDKEL